MSGPRRLRAESRALGRSRLAAAAIFDQSLGASIVNDD